MRWHVRSGAQENKKGVKNDAKVPVPGQIKQTPHTCVSSRMKPWTLDRASEQLAKELEGEVPPEWGQDQNSESPVTVL